MGAQDAATLRAAPRDASLYPQAAGHLPPALDPDGILLGALARPLDETWSNAAASLPPPSRSVRDAPDLSASFSARHVLSVGPLLWAGRAYASFPPSWASVEHLSWLRMPLILHAARLDVGAHILHNLSDPMLLSRPPAPHGAVGGIGCVPPYRLALDTTSPVSPAAFLAGSTSTVPIGWLVAALRAGLQRLGVTRAVLVRCFDGHRAEVFARSRLAGELNCGVMIGTVFIIIS